MLARVATFNSLPEDLNAEAVDRLRTAVKETPGFVAGYHLGAPGGKALSVIVVEGTEAFESIAQALGQRTPGQRVGIDPDNLEFFEAQPF